MPSSESDGDGPLSPVSQGKVRQAYERNQPMSGMRINRALSALGVRPTLEQVKTFLEDNKLGPRDTVSFRQFQSFYETLNRGRKKKSKLREGMSVEARFGGRNRWFKGEITRQNGDGTFDITYEDGDKERRVKAKLIRPLGGDDEAAGKATTTDSDPGQDGGDLLVGAKVEARFGGRSRWFKGEIKKENSDGTFDIRYEDGDKERRVKRDLIRPLEMQSSSSSDPKKKKKKKKKSPKIREGMKVEARFGGRSRWFKGEITKENSDGTFDIRYEDGDKERRVKADLIRPLDGGGNDGSDSNSDDGGGGGGDGGGGGGGKLKEGAKVEARFGGRSRWFKGEITRVRDDDTFDIRYEDGDSERRVKRDLIRLLGGDEAGRVLGDTLLKADALEKHGAALEGEVLLVGRV